jgi:hypothetical protein
VKVRGWGWLVGAGFFGLVVAWDLITGVSYVKSPASRATDPDMFWFGVGFAGLLAAI